MEHHSTATLVRARAEQPANGMEGAGANSPPRMPARLLQHSSSRGHRYIRRLRSEGTVLFLLCLGAYLTVAVLLDFHYLSFNGDAVSRMANGFYVLYSRDPHLAAIGFVWNPGTSIADLVPLLFYHLWTPLASHMFAGSLVSAVAMAGAVYQVRCTLFEWGAPRAPRLVLVAILALNGMVVYYGGNGMSEGLYLCSLLAACRYLLRWIRNNDLTSLVYAATALGLCYIVRNEAVGAAFLGGVVVIVVGYARRSDLKTGRLRAALNDAVIIEIPCAVALVGWAVASYVITGSPFEQFTSVYGTTSQIKVAGHAALRDRLLQDVHDVLYMAPAIPLILIVALVVARRRRDFGLLAPLAVVGGGLSFDLLAYVDNSIQPWFRYFMTAVPLEVLLVGSLLATAPALIPRLRPRPKGRIPSRRWPVAVVSLLGVLTALLLLVPAEVTTIMGMSNPKVGFEETQHLTYIFNKHAGAFYEDQRYTYSAEALISNYLVHMHLANGQVIVDNFSACIPEVITVSPNPDVFVIPNDRSFQRTLADPLTFHAHYILDVDPTQDGTLTAPNITYPNLWATGDGFTKVAHVFRSYGNCAEFKLLKVIGHPIRNG
jgi:hypothetical protein